MAGTTSLGTAKPKAMLKRAADRSAIAADPVATLKGLGRSGSGRERVGGALRSLTRWIG